MSAAPAPAAADAAALCRPGLKRVSRQATNRCCRSPSWTLGPLSIACLDTPFSSLRHNIHLPRWPAHLVFAAHLFQRLSGSWHPPLVCHLQTPLTLPSPPPRPLPPHRPPSPPQTHTTHTHTHRARKKNTVASLEAELSEKLSQLQLLSAENEMLKLRAGVLEATVSSSSLDRHSSFWVTGSTAAFVDRQYSSFW